MNFNKILFLAHSNPTEYVFEDTRNYLKRFHDVEIKSVFEHSNLAPFPKSVKEINLSYMAKFGPLYESPFFNAMLDAEKSGYGAAVVASWGDPAIGRAVKELKFPVVGLAWANYKKASELYGKFSILHTHLPELMDFNKMQVEMYGFQGNLVSSEHLDLDVYEWLNKKTKPDYQFLAENTLPIVEKCAEKGAKSLLIACGSPELSEFAQVLDNEVKNKFGIRVLTPLDTMIETARERIKNNPVS
ncbi:MAG: hypothetical protein HQM08_21140 [Candidatus Riflebacteria bacterium]|nr:hypothetical protein [Candidatus Riflebacteria bacterium]